MRLGEARKRGYTAPCGAIIRAVSNARIELRVQARARREELVRGGHGGLLARVPAPALEGRANDAVCRLLARRLGVAPSRVTIVRGLRSRDKVVQVEGVEQATVDELLEL